MSSRGWRGGSLMFLVFAAVAVLGQSRSLNPTVTVLPRAVAPVPAECDIGPGLAAPEPIRVADLPQTRSVEDDLVAPPSSDLRSLLRSAQEASDRNDRDSFRESLAGAKTLLANYPPGAEKSAANEVVAVHNDLLRLWNYQFDTPTGAFFDGESEGGAILQMMNRYSGYSAFIADQTISAGGTRIYPTRESRDFLTREAAQRLQRLGIRSPAPQTPARTTPATRTTTSQPSEDPSRAMPSVVPRSRTPGATQTPTTTSRTQPRTTTTTPGKTASAPRTSSTPRQSTSKPTATKTSSSKPSTRTSTSRPAQTSPQVTRRTQPQQSAAPPPVPPTDEELAALGLGTAPGPGAAPPAATVPSPATAATPPLAPPVTDTAFATDTVPNAATADPSMVDTAATDTAATDTAISPQPARGPNFIVPLILILIGIGVLIVLFRASS